MYVQCSPWTAITSRFDICFIKRLYVSVGNKHVSNLTKCTLHCVTSFLCSIIQLWVLLNPSTSEKKGGFVLRLPRYHRLQGKGRRSCTLAEVKSNDVVLAKILLLILTPWKYQYYTVYEHFLPKIYVLACSLVFTVVNHSCCTMYLRLDISPAKKLKMDLNTKCPNFDSNTKFNYSGNQIPRVLCFWTKCVQTFKCRAPFQWYDTYQTILTPKMISHYRVHYSLVTKPWRIARQCVYISIP